MSLEAVLGPFEFGKISEKAARLLVVFLVLGMSGCIAILNAIFWCREEFLIISSLV